jgi:hypothetical protein
MTEYKLRRKLQLPCVELMLNTSKSLSLEHAFGLRGYVGRQYPEDTLLHNHRDGSFVYSYPRVQYKIINNCGYIIGLAEGAEAVKKIRPFNSVMLGDEVIELLEYKLTERKATFGITDDQNTYSFFSPWLALNEQNYQKYKQLRTRNNKRKLLEKILVGNIIAMSKGLDYTVPEPIIANFKVFEEISTALKATTMLGFLGTFSVNFEIPDYWGIGKSVSRGFGTVKAVLDDSCRC